MTIFADHKPLTLALFRVSPPWSAWQQRHLAYLAEFTSSIVHMPGIKNVVADALSRPSPFPKPVLEPVSVPTASSLVSPQPSAVPPPVLANLVLSSYDFCRFSTIQLTCPSVSKMKSSPSLSLVSVRFGKSSLLCDVSLGSLFPLVPLELRLDLFKLLYSSSHPGISASRRLL